MMWQYNYNIQYEVGKKEEEKKQRKRKFGEEEEEDIKIR